MKIFLTLIESDNYSDYGIIPKSFEGCLYKEEERSCVGGSGDSFCIKYCGKIIRNSKQFTICNLKLTK